MGTTLSSNKDYNRVLARQTRESINLTKLEPSNSVQQYPLTGTLSIPDPVRVSQLNNHQSSTNPAVSNQTPIQSIQERNLSPIIDNSIKQSSLRSSTFLMSNQIMNGDAFVIARSIVNLNKHQRLNSNHLSSFQPSGTIVERNGKQFLTELKQRMEQRYVQFFDENLGRMRLFEVTDYIPSRTVRAVKNNPQLQNGTSRNILPANSQPNQQLALPYVPKDRTESAKPSNFNNPETLARETDPYHSGTNLPSNTNTAPSTTPSQPQQTIRDSTKSQSQAYSSLSIGSKTVPNRYSSGSHRTIGSVESLTASSGGYSNSDEESYSEEVDQSPRISNQRSGNNRNNTGVSYGTVAGYNSPTQLDPFARPVNANDHHHYAKRPGINNYSEPNMNKQAFEKSTASDYAPIPMVTKQPNRDRYSHRKNSNTTAYNG